MIHIDRAVRQALHLYDLKAADGCRGGVGAVGGVGDEDFGAGPPWPPGGGRYIAAKVAPLRGAKGGFMICPNHHQPCQLAVGTGVGVEGKLGEAGYFGEHLLLFPIEAQGTLYGVGRLGGVELREGRQGGHLFVDFGVVLHRATAQGIEARINAEVVVRHVGVVASHGLLVGFGQAGGFVAAHSGGQAAEAFGFHFAWRQAIAHATWARKLKDEVAI